MKFSLLICIACIFNCSCNTNQDVLEKKIKPLSYEGIVSEKFLDSNDRMTPKVTLMIGDVFSIYAYDAWDYIKIGDSLSKPSGSLKHTVFRKGVAPVSFYPKIDGKEIR